MDLSAVLATLESWRRVTRLTTVARSEVHRAMYRRAAARLADGLLFGPARGRS
ncbi:MAG: hypothetical protein M3300_07705 [Actinomycetota bacterium]|nr:hypothetical protein [Actinomycetota bacterium]